MTVKHRRSTTAGVGLVELAEGAKVTFGQEVFEKRLTKYFEEIDLVCKLPAPVLAKLHKRTLRFLKLKIAIGCMRKVLHSADWKKDSLRIRRVRIRKLPNLIRDLRSFHDIESIAPLLGSAELKLKDAVAHLTRLERYRQVEESVLSGHLRPEPESQFALELDDYLRRVLPYLKRKQHLEILTGCFVAGNLLKGHVGHDELPQVLSMRLSRARQSYGRASVKWFPWPD